MSDTYSRMRQLIGTTAQWQTCNIILGKGEIGIEVHADGTVSMRIGDGATQFSQCPEISGTGGMTGIVHLMGSMDLKTPPPATPTSGDTYIHNGGTGSPHLDWNLPPNTVVHNGDMVIWSSSPTGGFWDLIPNTNDLASFVLKGGDVMSGALLYSNTVELLATRPGNSVVTKDESNHLIDTALADKVRNQHLELGAAGGVHGSAGVITAARYDHGHSNATPGITGLPGFMSVADKEKLDALTGVMEVIGGFDFDVNPTNAMKVVGHVYINTKTGTIPIAAGWGQPTGSSPWTS